MKLVFINELGPDFKGNHIYEFIFSRNEEELWGEDWDIIPSAGRPLPPDLKYINKVGKISNEELEFELGKNSDYFSMEDVIDGILALGWEKIDEEKIEGTSRLVFNFGETIDSVEDKLYSRDLVLEYNKHYENVE